MNLALSQILFVPSVSDASPRVITQGLALNCSIIVNKEIFGGFKYVNEQTGSYFTDENDIVDIV